MNAKKETSTKVITMMQATGIAMEWVPWMENAKKETLTRVNMMMQATGIVMEDHQLDPKVALPDEHKIGEIILKHLMLTW